MSGRVTRRVVSALIAAATLSLWSGRSVAALPLAQARGLVSLFDDPGSVRAIGEACLKSLPPEQRAFEHLTGTLAALARPSMGQAAIRRRVVERVRQDFARGDTVEVDGWLLSATEARIYALVALTQTRNA